MMLAKPTDASSARNWSREPSITPMEKIRSVVEMSWRSEFNRRMRSGRTKAPTKPPKTMATMISTSGILLCLIAFSPSASVIERSR